MEVIMPQKIDENIIWAIGEMEELTDTFRSPMSSGSFEVKNKKVEGWPSFHASEADPDGKYKAFEYTVHFELEEAADACLHIGLIVSTPRFPDVRIDVNGVCGNYYPYPTPSKDREIKPTHALHAAIYNREDANIYLPAGLFHKGRNYLTLTAVDPEPAVRIENEQAVLRLDRMADACGFHYGALELVKMAGEPDWNRCELLSGVIYIKAGNGNLAEKCSVRFDNLKCESPKLQGRIFFTWKNGELTLPYSLPIPAFGQVKLPFLLPDGEGAVRYEFEGSLKHKGEFRRKRKWNVYTTPHAHTDIGYTHRQWEVAERLCRNIDTILDLLKGEYADNYSYIIDSAWPLEEYLNSRGSKRKEELIAAIRNRKFGVPWNYTDLLTWLPSLEALIHNGDYADGFLEPYGLRADRADIVDVASATSAYPAVLAGSGVKYLLHADNQDRGPFRFNGQLHRHSPFWWKSPDGSRVLTWLARMYCELKKVCGSPASMEAAERGLEMWLLDYERETYAPDAVLLYGQEADNTDIDTRCAAFLAKWEKEIVYPRLIPSDGSAFFDYVMKFSDTFDEYCGDEGAYWEDGAASSIKETIDVRKAEAEIKCAEGLDSLAAIYAPGLSFPSEHYKEAWKQVLLYDEHTWGAFLSGADADSVLQKDQWAVKQNMAVQAKSWGSRLLTQAATRISLMWNNESREVVVYNPYSFPVQGTVPVEFALGETILEQTGKEAVWEETGRTQSQISAGLWVEALQPYSYRRYRLVKKEEGNHGGAFCTEEIQDTAVLENAWYLVKISAATGCILSLYDKELKKELCSCGSLGQLLYAYGGEGTTLTGNHPGLSREGASVKPCFKPLTARKRISRAAEAVILKGSAELGELECIFTLPKNEKALYLEYNYNKEATERLEAVYVDFPFALPELGDILSDSQTGWVNWSRDILPGACREWLPLQTSVLMKGDAFDIQIASPDAFLFTVGTPVEGKWTSDIETRGNRIYSYVLNNYWRTNYLGKQGGQIRFRYAITSAGEILYEKAYRFGWTKRQGLVAQRMSYQEFRNNVPEVYRDSGAGTLMDIASEHIVVSTIRGARDGKGFILRLQETGGYPGDVKVAFPGRRIEEYYRTDHQERNLRKINSGRAEYITLHLKPWEVNSYRLIFEPSDI
jgi:hypothetical protein